MVLVGESIATHTVMTFLLLSRHGHREMNTATRYKIAKQIIKSRAVNEPYMYSGIGASSLLLIETIAPRIILILIN